VVKDDIGLRQFVIVQYFLEQIVRRLNANPFT
jgi:hypothetical protein